ncbi:hypothetical protein FH972_023401 [Carpinus fangiana]|uniref:NAD(P)-binding domain-containing protein n=1 Tax=Carpinus fangiana TaxID=176857 RepID=A0A5N6KVG9_9ROSI|nr:hypothetical protein FH972_023401 [Carpinus fangiana]
MATAALIGSTGLVGSRILSTLLAPSPATEPITAVHAFSRRPLPATTADPSSRLRPHTSSDTASWPADYASLGAPAVFFSALGTTRAAAGSFAKQREVDYDQNLAMAKAALAAGTTTYVLISSGGSNEKSLMPYMRMKGEIETAVSALDFEHIIILKPGLLIGKRPELRTAEYILQLIAGALGVISKRWLTDWWAQDAGIIAKAAVKAGVDASQGKVPEGVGKGSTAASKIQIEPKCKKMALLTSHPTDNHIQRQRITYTSHVHYE